MHRLFKNKKKTRKIISLPNKTITTNSKDPEYKKQKYTTKQNKKDSVEDRPSSNTLAKKGGVTTSTPYE